MSEDFGAFITSRRRELELTLGDVATQLDVSPITVSNWSNGQSTPDSDQLSALAALLDVPADELTSMAGTVLDEAPAKAVPSEAPADPPDEPEAPPVDSELEMAETIEEASAEVEVPEADLPEVDVPEVDVPEVEVPAFVEAEVPAVVETPAPAPEPARRAAGRRSRSATATAERPVATTLPLTYIEDPKALMRYRIRWGITLVALVVMFFILLWAAGGLISALSDIKESVTPGGGS